MLMLDTETLQGAAKVWFVISQGIDSPVLRNVEFDSGHWPGRSKLVIIMRTRPVQWDGFPQRKGSSGDRYKGLAPAICGWSDAQKGNNTWHSQHFSAPPYTVVICPALWAAVPKTISAGNSSKDV